MHALHYGIACKKIWWILETYGQSHQQETKHVFISTARNKLLDSKLHDRVHSLYICYIRVDLNLATTQPSSLNPNRTNESRHRHHHRHIFLS